MKKAISVILIIVNVFLSAICLASCNSEGQNKENIRDVKLEIENVNAEYSEDFTKDVTERLTVISRKLLSYLGYSEELIPSHDKIYNKIENNVIPKLKLIPIYENELKKTTEIAENFLSESENNFKNENSFGLFTDLYKNLLYSLSSEKIGSLAYIFSLEYLSAKADESLKKYEKYGYSWHLEYYEKYNRMISGFENHLGEEGFSYAVGTLVFLSSFVTSIYNDNKITHDLPISSSDIVNILRKQADYFEKNSLTEDAYSLLGEFFGEFISAKGTLLEAEAYALKQENYYENAFIFLKDFLTYYSKCAKKLSSDTIEGIEDKERLYHTIFEIILSNEEDFRILLSSFEAKCATKSELERSAIISTRHIENYDLYSNDIILQNQDELISAIKGYCDSLLNEDELKEAFCGYLHGKIPYLLYALTNS